PAPAPVRLLAWTHDLAATNPRYGGFRRPGHPYTLIATAQPRVRYVAVSAARAAEVANALGLTPAQVPVVPNGIDPAAFLDIGESTRDLGRRAGFAGADPLVLVPARVTRRKRLELAIAAAAQLRRRHPRLRVVVTGALGPHTADNRAYQCELAALRDGAGLQDVVVFCHEHGAGDDNAHPVDGAMMAELYRLADVVLLTSESEGFGLPVLEAALARVPIVCPDIPILREVGGDGLIAFPADGGPGQVAAAVDLALDLPGPRLRSRVLRANDWDRVRRQLEDQIEAALA
ncbi:MAG: glycosyltransferase family 4 protein, partial [Candidatus Dormibacteraceae bacterium]